MKKYIYFILGILITGAVTSVVFAAPTSQSTRSLLPFTTDQYYIGTSSPSTIEYSGIFTKDLTVSGTCTGCGAGGGGDFAWTPTGYGVATSTTLGFLNGFLSTASSTISGVLHATGGVTGTLTGNADTATNLAANGSNCSAGSYPLGVGADGAADGVENSAGFKKYSGQS